MTTVKLWKKKIPIHCNNVIIFGLPTNEQQESPETLVHTKKIKTNNDNSFIIMIIYLILKLSKKKMTTSNVANICSHRAVNSDNPRLRTSNAGGPRKRKKTSNRDS